MLLDPLEKQLDLPAAAIKLGDGERRQREVVGEKHQRFALVGFEPNAAQRFWVARLGVEHGKRNRLIADQASGAVDRVRVAPLGFEIGLRARDKERSGEVQSVQALEVEIAPVHYGKGARFGKQLVEHIDIVPPEENIKLRDAR